MSDLFSDISTSSTGFVDDAAGETVFDTAPPTFSEPVEDTPPAEDDIRSADFGPVPAPKNKRDSKIKTGIEQLYTAGGMIVAPFDQQVGITIVQNAEQCAIAWDKLAKENVKVKRVLEGMLETSAWSMVIFAHAPIAVLVATKYVPYLRDQYGERFNETPEHNSAAM